MRRRLPAWRPEGQRLPLVAIAGAWQRHLNEAGRYAAQCVLKRTSGADAA